MEKYCLSTVFCGPDSDIILKMSEFAMDCRGLLGQMAEAVSVFVAAFQVYVERYCTAKAKRGLGMVEL